MVIKQPFTTVSQAIVSYDFTDLSNGSGVEFFYLYNTNDSVGFDYWLVSETSFKSDTAQTTVAAVGGGMTLAGNFDFDFNFEIPRDVIGLIHVNFSHVMVGNINGNHTSFIICKLFHFDGTTETQIGASVQSPTRTSGGAGSWVSFQTALRINAGTTPIHFAASDTLRLTVEIWDDLSTGNGTVGIGTDPAGRDTSAASSGQSFVAVPFKIDT